MSTAIKASDLRPSRSGESEPRKSSRQILVHELIEGIGALERRTGGLFLSGLSAGLDIGFSVLAMAVLATLTQGVLPDAIVKLLMANLYTIGFIVVVVGRSELFTEQTTLAVLPVLGGRATVGALGRLWGIVLLSNLVGAAIVAALMVMIGPALGTIEKDAFTGIALAMTEHSMPVMFGSAVLAGWLMGLMSWLVAAARDTVSQIIIVWLIAFVIGVAGLHHSIVGSVEVLAGVFANDTVGWGDFGRFLLMAVLGNALGGSVFVALIKYGHAARGDEKRESRKDRQRRKAQRT